MAISDKLLYLNGTKQAIKDELNRFGSNITENDTFRSYSNVINDIYDKLPKVSGNGSDFSLENAQNGKLDSFGMDGNTEQTTYSGKNLCSSAKLQNAQNVRFYIDKKIEKTLTISFTTNERLNTNSLYLSATNTLATTITADANTKATATFTLSDEQYSAIQNATNSYFLLFKSGANFTIPTDAQIENGSNATDYEPYCGGTPSPNPDYPQEVKVVENEQNINVHGKNLIEGSQDFSGIWNNSQNWETDTNSYNNLIVKKNQGTWNGINKEIYITAGTYTFSLFAKSDSARTVNIYLGGTLTTDNLIPQSKQLNLTTEWQRYDVTFTSNANGTVKPRLENPTQISNNYTYVCGYQLQQGNLTEYEPYQSQDYEIDLGDIELCKIGDYQDVIFKNNQLSSYYDSTLDEDSWYIKKEIGKVVLDGSEDNWNSAIFRELTDVAGFRQNVKYSLNMLSDKFISNTPQYLYDANVEGITYSSTGNYFVLYINKNRLSSVSLSALKTWLSTHNTIIYYVLDTPTYETITNETLISQLESIETFTGLNNFSVSNENNVLPTLYVNRLKELGKLE